MFGEIYQQGRTTVAIGNATIRAIARSGSFKDSEFLTSLKNSNNAKKGRASGTGARDARTLERSKRFMATRRMVRIFASGVSGHVASRDFLQWYFKIRPLYLSGQMDKVGRLAVLRWLLAKQFHALTDWERRQRCFFR